MFKLLFIGACCYALYRWWTHPARLPEEQPHEDEYADYEEVE